MVVARVVVRASERKSIDYLIDDIALMERMEVVVGVLVER